MVKGTASACGQIAVRHPLTSAIVPGVPQETSPSVGNSSLTDTRSAAAPPRTESQDILAWG